MKKTSKVLKQYFKEIKKHLSCSWSEKNAFISYIQDQLDYNILNDNNLTKEQLVELLGEPNVVAKSFDSVNQKELRVRAKVCTLAMLLTISLIVIVALLAVILIYELNHLGGIHTIFDK